MFGVRVFDMARTELPLINGAEEMTAPGVSVGICLSAVLMWVKETIVQGDMSNDEILRSNRQVISMRQASFQFNSRVSHCEYLDLKKSVIQDLLGQYKLKVVREGEGDLFDFSEIAECICSLPGYYLIYFKNPQDDKGHAIGFKFVSDGRSYLFDPAEGMYQFQNSNLLLNSMKILNSASFEEYLGGQYWYKQLTLG